MARRLSFIGVVAIGVFATGLIAACSASNATNAFTGGAGGDDNSSGDGSGAGKASGTSTMSGQGSGDGVGGGSILIDGGNSDATDDANACAADTTKAQQLPLDLFIMLDQSGSMSDITQGNVTKWQAVTGALNAFVQQPEAAGIGVGIQYFGLPPGGAQCPASCVTDADCGAFGPCFPGLNFCENCPVGGDSCNAADYSTADVEIAPLPGVAQAISDSLAKHMPTTSTPTSAALQGAIQHAETWVAAHPTHTTLVIFATDGDPTECDTDLSHINAIAGAGYGHVPKILTFVIGVGSSLGALNGIAMAGGTNQAFIVDTNANVNQQFLDAMNKIRGAALSCEYLIPSPEAGMADFDKLNVQYTPGGGGKAQIFPEVADKAHCPMDSDAWYYDNPAMPTKIEMCNYSCQKLAQDSKGELDILVGCKTIIN